MSHSLETKLVAYQLQPEGYLPGFYEIHVNLLLVVGHNLALFMVVSISQPAQQRYFAQQQWSNVDLV